MERLLLGTAHMLALARKRRTAGGGIEEFLGEFLDTVYKRSGVLVDAPPAAAGGGPAGAAGTVTAAITPGAAAAGASASGGSGSGAAGKSRAM